MWNKVDKTLAPSYGEDLSVWSDEDQQYVLDDGSGIWFMRNDESVTDQNNDASVGGQPTHPQTPPTR